MIKKIVLAIMIALPATLFAQKFGIVDADAIMQAMPEMAQAQSQLEESSKKYQTEFDALNEEMNKKYTELQNVLQDSNTPDAIKERRMQEVQELDNKLQQFRNTAQQDLARQQQQLFAPIQQKLLEAIKAVGKEGNYTFIFQQGMALYDGDSVVDVTSAVKAKLGIK